MNVEEEEQAIAKTNGDLSAKEEHSSAKEDERSTAEGKKHLTVEEEVVSIAGHSSFV